MADNMIELIARLDTDTSAGEINKTDIPDLQKQINKLQIKCNLDTGSINALKNQFSKLSTSFGSTGIKKVTDDIVKKFNDSFNMVGKVSEESKKQFNAQTKQLLQEFKDAWNKGMESGDFSGYENILDKLDQRVREFNRGDIQQLKQNIAEIRSFFTDGSKVSIGSNLKGWLDNATGSNSLTREYLDAIYGKNNYTIGAGNSGFDTLLKKDEDAAESIINSAQKIIEYQKKIRSTGWALDELEEIGYNTKEYLEAQERASNNIEDKLREIVGLSQRVRTTEGQWFDIDSDYDNIKNTNELAEAYEEAAEQSEYFHRKQELLQQDYDILSAKINKAKLNIDELATREIETGEKINYNEVFAGLMSDGITNNKKLGEARDALAAIRKEFQIVNAQMSSEIPQNAIENLAQRIAKLDSQIKLVNLDFNKLTLAPDDLKASFDKLNSLTDNFDFSPDYQVESKEALNERVKSYTQIRVALNETQSLLKVAQKEEATLNKETERSLKNKQRQLEIENQLREKQQHDYWQGRFEETIKAQTAENQVLKDMKNYYEDSEKASKKAEKARQQEENRAINLSNRIKRLTADVASYASANQRAVNSLKQMTSGSTFAAEWSRITAEAAKGADLTDRELKNLSADMAVFRKEAQAAGLAGESAFGKFINSFKVMSSYITANMVFNFVKRQLRDMVQEVTAVDTAMVELRKVTEATDEQFEAFASSAGQTGRELGASVSDVINATATFARLGESLPDAEELGKVATLYKNVGDGIDIETASEDIVSTMKAFKIEAKDAITIVDKLNEVGEICCP